MSFGQHRLVICISAALLSQLWMPWPKSHAAVPIDVLLIVAGRSFPGTDIAYADLRSAYRGRRVKVAGKTLVPIHHPRDSLHRTAFDRIVLGLGPAAVGRFWVDMRIRDQASPPTTASTPQLALRMAAVLPGAVSYATEVAVLPTLKVLTVDGRKATDYDYPIKP